MGPNSLKSRTLGLVRCRWAPALDLCRDDEAQDDGRHIVSTHMLAIKCGHLTGWLDKISLDCEGSSPGIHASQFPFPFPFSSVVLNLPAQDQPWSECADN